MIVYVPLNDRILSGSFQSRSQAVNLTRKYFTKKARKPFDKTDLKIFKGIQIFKGQKHVSQIVDKRIQFYQKGYLWLGGVLLHIRLFTTHQFKTLSQLALYFRKFLNLIVFMTHELTKVKCKETVKVTAVLSSKIRKMASNPNQGSRNHFSSQIQNNLNVLY